MEEIFVSTAPENYSNSLVHLDSIPQSIANSRTFIENAMKEARGMPNHPVIQSGLIWSAGLAGIGRYAKQSGSRIIGVELQCGDDYDYSKATLQKAFTTWSNHGFELATIVVPNSYWYEAGQIEERQKMTYWFYQQTMPNVLRLEYFGSNQYGWWKTNGLGSESFKLAVRLGKINMAEYVQKPAFLSHQEILYLAS